MSVKNKEVLTLYIRALISDKPSLGSLSQSDKIALQKEDFYGASVFFDGRAVKKYARSIKKNKVRFSRKARKSLSPVYH